MSLLTVAICWTGLMTVFITGNWLLQQSQNKIQKGGGKK